ncbi:UV DNA damage repair endonuclease UvsE [Sabulicella glaciei]|uniref:UV DNA damage repair endonuclease UvsE n=1 Tax=Sabulicella glaciei TaxID=2984948 RepID=A0ABT3NSW9_9PROT|nr:UV DNA damage repair endonuclease UvsE [Roseococcus sp. MDT2-1-1]
MTSQAPMRLGVPVKILADPSLKSNDARRWQSGPHLRVSLEYLDAILDHLARRDIRMYRMSSDLAPYATHPDMPQFHSMVRECAPELAAIGAKARRLGIRLSFHPSQFVVINSPDPELVRKSVADLTSQAEMLDRMEQGPEAVLIIHTGGHYGDRQAALERWARNWEDLPEPVRRRLVLENDDLRFDAADVLWLHERTGVRLIFDHQHFWCLNRQGLEVASTFRRFLASWPEGQRPKMHFSSPRTEMREVKRPVPGTKRTETKLIPPVWTGHADFINPFEFATFLREVPEAVFDVMLEAKAKDLALERLRADLPRYAPDVGLRFGFAPAATEEALEEEAEAAE